MHGAMTWMQERWRAEGSRYRRLFAGDAGGLFGVRGAFADAAVAAFALLELDERFEETRAIEIGPKRFGDEDFSVGDLPKQEIRDAHFAAGADEQVGVG